MTRRQSRWVNVIIIALVVILRLPTLLPSLYNSDEGYYGIIANDTLDGGTFYRTAVDTKPPGIYYIYVAVFKVAGKNNLFAVDILAILVVVATALVVRRIGARVADDWAGAWSGIGYAVFVHTYRPGDTLPANTEIFANLAFALSVLAFLQGGRKVGWGWMFLSGALVGVATLIRQPSAVTMAAMLAYLVYGWLIPRTQSLGRVLAAGSGVVTGFIAVIAGLAWYFQWQGNLHDAYLWAWACANRERAAYFVVGPQLSGDLYWMAISGTLSFGSTSAAFDSRWPGFLTLCGGTATFSPATLAMDPSRHY